MGVGYILTTNTLVKKSMKKYSKFAAFQTSLNIYYILFIYLLFNLILVHIMEKIWI